MNEDKSTRYHRLRRRAVFLGALWQVSCLLLLMLTGVSHVIRDMVAGAVGTGLVPLVPVYVLIVSGIYGVVQVPLVFYRDMLLERRYQLSVETAARWWADHIKAGTLVLAYLVASGVLLAWLIRVSPDRWWMIASLGSAAGLVLLAQIGPQVLLPRFAHLKPLDRGGLRARLLDVAERAGAPVTDVFEWCVGHRTKKANAVLIGLGRSRRILVSDTLLAGHSDDEVEAVLAHEIAHHVYGDIWSSILLDVASTTAGFHAADVFLTRYAGALGLDGKGDVAGLPLLALAVSLVSLGCRPIVNALSRAHERRADRYALEMTKNASAFIRAMQRLSARNLAEDRPSRLVKILFHTHPATADRIAAARAWELRSP